MRGAHAVVINGIVYVGGGWCCKDCIVCRYHPIENEWAELPPSPVKYFGVGQVSGQLVLVGGRVASTGKVTGDVLVFVSDSQSWEKSVTAMPTARQGPSVVSHSTVLVVCGGMDDSSTTLPTVEMYSSEASQWYQCPALPFSRDFMSSVTIGDTLFLVGGYSEREVVSATRSILSASLTALIDRALHRSSGSASAESLWTPVSLEDVPYYRSAAASIGGYLLALGGTDTPEWNEASDSIRTYLHSSSTWTQTGKLPLPCYRTTAVLLPTNELLIIGGYNKEHVVTQQVFKGTLQV